MKRYVFKAPSFEKLNFCLLTRLTLRRTISVVYLPPVPKHVSCHVIRKTSCKKWWSKAEPRNKKVEQKNIYNNSSFQVWQLMLFHLEDWQEGISHWHLSELQIDMWAIVMALTPKDIFAKSLPVNLHSCIKGFLWLLIQLLAPFRMILNIIIA